MAKIRVQELSIPGCVECAKFERFWESIKINWPEVEFQKIDGTSSEGQAIIQKYGILASPGIIINEELFSMGGVNQKAFIEKLQNLSKT